MGPKLYKIPNVLPVNRIAFLLEPFYPLRMSIYHAFQCVLHVPTLILYIPIIL